MLKSPTTSIHRGFGARTEIIENAVHRALVEDPVVAKAPEIELETLELEADIARHVRDDDRAEVRRPALEQRELRRIALDTAERAERRELRDTSCRSRSPGRDTDSETSRAVRVVAWAKNALAAGSIGKPIAHDVRGRSRAIGTALTVSGLR